MKYKYEFEAHEDFEVGFCFHCPLAYLDDYCELRCFFEVDYERCPLVKVDD